MTVRGRGADGGLVERATFLSVEAQPESGSRRSRLILVGIGLAALLLFGGGLLAAVFVVRRRRRAHQTI